VQRASEQVIDRRRDWGVLAETRRTRVKQAEGCDSGAEQYSSTANDSEGDIREDEKSHLDLRDVTTFDALTIKHECYSPRITRVADVTSPVIQDKDVRCQREAAKE
jgi:hypothetical protein